MKRVPHAPESLAGGFSRNDGTVQFYTRVQALLPEKGVVLDYGAGRGAGLLLDTVPVRRSLRLLKGKDRFVVAVDVDPAVAANPGADARILIDDSQLPFADETVDLIVADMVFEHLSEPERILPELSRVLRPGGWICARTPNLHGYIAIGSRIVPNSLHVRVLGRIQPDREEVDVFPTVYRANTLRQLERFFPPESYRHCSFGHFPDPAYLSRYRIARSSFRLLNRLTPERFAAMLMIFIQKR